MRCDLGIEDQLRDFRGGPALGQLIVRFLNFYGFGFGVGRAEERREEREQRELHIRVNIHACGGSVWQAAIFLLDNLVP
jgi:hypothetical protein